MHMQKEGIGKRIREARMRAGITQTELAKKTGLGQGTISNIERGHRGEALEANTVDGIARILGEDPSYLLTGVRTPRKAPTAHLFTDADLELGNLSDPCVARRGAVARLRGLASEEAIEEIMALPPSDNRSEEEWMKLLLAFNERLRAKAGK